MGDGCRDCGHDLRADARFCDGCGARVAPDDSRAEYKQVTVLFADVVHSMDLAAAVGAERLREIMAELFDRSSAVVRQFGGTVDKFTGDGVMAVFGAPIALEDHAIRACLAALALQEDARGLAVDVDRRDGITLQLRVGLNSGEVIAGEIGSGSATYTAIGEQVGMAQRMETVAPAGGVMLSESTARLVDGHAVLGERQHVRIKGAVEPVVARRLLAAEGGRGARQLSSLIGRQWELSTVAGMLDQAVNGKGHVLGLVGPPGIGKSRLGWEVSSMAAERGVDVFTASCESHTSELPFYVVTRLLRNIFVAGGGSPADARAALRVRMPEADPEDLVLLDDLLGIRDQETPLPVVDPDARRRRLAILLNTAAAARPSSAVYVVEDVHWIDEVSEAMLAEVAAVMPQTRSLMLVTYRPEYGGPLDRLPGAHRIALAPLDDSESTALAAELLGEHSSVTGLVATIAGRAAGNPFFAEEIIRDLAERGVLTGEPGAYAARTDAAEVRVPATLQATIAARIDRLAAQAKRTLNAAAVIGSQFDEDLVSSLVTEVDIAELVTGELIDQWTFTRPALYAFRHPMIRTVAYESQLKADRAQLHRTLAKTIADRNPGAADEQAALIAQHLDTAGDLRDAYEWHMRAGMWAQVRDVRAARTSWLRALDVADLLPDDGPIETAMRIDPRALLAVSGFRFSGSIEDIRFEELRELCGSVGDNLSLGMGMAGKLTALVFHNRLREAAQVAAECVDMLESLPEDAPTLLIWAAASNAQFQAGDVTKSLRSAQRVIDLAHGDVTKNGVVVGSPLGLSIAMRGANRFALGMSGWREDFDHAIRITRGVDTTTHVAAVLLKVCLPVHFGGLLPDAMADAVTAEALDVALRSGDAFSVDAARLSRGIVLVRGDGLDRTAGLDLLAQYRGASLKHGYTAKFVRWADSECARQLFQEGDLDGAIELARGAVDFLYETGDMVGRGPAVTVLVEALLSRGAESDVTAARAAIERLAAVSTDPGFVLHELPLHRLRALLARVDRDDAAYQDHLDQYGRMANDLGFEGHMAIAAAMR